MVAVITPPHEPEGWNVNAAHPVAPAAITPKFCWLPARIPPVACNVPTRPAVGALPAFRTQKFTVTISNGSITIFGGEQLSPVRVVASASNAGCGAETHCGNLKLPI